MREIKAIIRPERLLAVVDALHQIDELPGLTVSVVRGYGKRVPTAFPVDAAFGEPEMAKVEIVVRSELTAPVVQAIQRAAHSGRPGDGNIFISPVEEAVRIRSGARGPDLV